jgi:hypothetical protein
MRAVWIVFLLAAGCATTSNAYWDKPGASMEQKQKEYTECRYEAAKATGGSPSGSITEDTATTIANDLAYGQRYGEIFSLCMQTKGFQLVSQ